MLNYPDANIRLILKYAKEKTSADIEEMNYRIYASDVLKSIADGLYSAFGADIKIERYYDLIRGKNSVQETKSMTADEIVESVLSKTGLKVI